MLTPKLKFLTHFFADEKIDSDKVLKCLGIASTQQLNSILEKNLQRHSLHNKTHHYIIQSTTSENSLSYLFTPFIYAVLNKNAIYIAPEKNIIKHVYSQYFRLKSLALKQEQSLNDMNLALNLISRPFNANELELYGLIKALTDPLLKDITLISEKSLSFDIKDQIIQIFNIKIHNILLRKHQTSLENIDFKKLFWKQKTSHLAQVCQQISLENAPLISSSLNLNLADAERLIDDLMYSEHLFEKISVFGEFTETIFKNHSESQMRYVHESN